MRLRCRFGIHDWNPWILTADDASNSLYKQQTTCKCCGIYRIRVAMAYNDMLK